MADLKDLIARCERATGGDRELDVRLYAELLDDRDIIERETWITGRSRQPPHDECALGRIDPGKVQRNFTAAFHAPEIPAYTSSIDAALALCERVLPGWWWHVSSTHCELHHPITRLKDRRASAKTAPLAIILAALKALEKDAKDKNL